MGVNSSGGTQRTGSLHLPAEIRLEIYGYAFEAWDFATGRDGKRTILKTATPMLRTCKLVRREAMPYYFDCLEDMYAYATGQAEAVDDQYGSMPDVSTRVTAIFSRIAIQKWLTEARELVERWEFMARVVERNLEKMREKAILQ